MPTIRAAIFDLDNCLAAANEPGEELFNSAFGAIREANDGRLSEDELTRALADCWRLPLDVVAKKHDFSDEMLAAAWKAFAGIEVRCLMRGYGDLETIADLPVERFLVTSGFRRLQESKVRALSLERLFTAIHIDAIDEPHRLGKRGLFKSIMHVHGFRPEHVLVVGDNPEAEIAAGNDLGMRTVQILRPGVERGDEAQFHIRELGELKELLQRLGQSSARNG